MTIQTHRLKAYNKQKGLCYYCNRPMWLDNVKRFAEINSISVKAAARFRCTAEHLEARSDVGSNSRTNIVAACIFCNQARHKRKKPPPPIEHRTRIQKRLEKGKWHPLSLQPACQD